jgi:hypothetical protein
MAKKNSIKKRQSRIADALVRERKQMEKQRERELKMKEEEQKVSVGRQIREKRSLKKQENTKGGVINVLVNGGIQKLKKIQREGKNRHKIVNGVRVGNATKIRKNVTYGGITIKDSESKKAVLEMLKAEDRMMV